MAKAKKAAAVPAQVRKAVKDLPPRTVAAPRLVPVDQVIAEQQRNAGLYQRLFGKAKAKRA